jgi:hypothetical protein
MKIAVALALIVATAVVAARADAAPPKIKVRVSNEMTAVFIEGYVWFVRLDRTKWKRVTGSSIMLSASPGRHVIHALVRPCDGNCSVLDPPLKRCAAVVRRGQIATYHLRDQGCKITVSG